MNQKGDTQNDMQNARLQSSKILGVAPDASLRDIKRAYRRIAKRLHPDRTGGDVTAFRRITAAYNLLLQQHRDGPSPKGFSSSRNQKSASAHAESARTTKSAKSSEAKPQNFGARQDPKVNFGDFRFEWSSHFAKAEKERRAKRKAASKQRACSPRHGTDP